jgi:hypothetical protein
MKLAFPAAGSPIIPIGIIALCLLFRGQSVIRTLMREPPSQERRSVLLIDGFQFALTTVLCYFIYQGQAWANVTLGVLSAIAGLVNIPFSLLALRSAFIGPTWLLIQAAVYLLASWILLRSPGV